ncbi:MAG: hypothetical protein KGD72_00190 [Candidatus Lokiarchaeota archaeon]|nr:hypothetical protein [Candidatus Lokiarchaeota archaeon]
MSSHSVERKLRFVHINESYEEEFVNFNNIIIPFSEFGNSKKKSYLYNGLEEMPFKVRHPKFKEILLNEFIEQIGESSNNSC